MSEPFIGEIRLFPYDFPPRGWAFCHGQLLSIAQNTALFALLGTTYGGDGRITFALPDLRGRVAVSSGEGPGLSAYELGGVGGVESVTLTEGEMPIHTHQVSANGRASSSSKPGNHYLGRASSGTAYASTTNGTTLNLDAVVPAGGSQPHENRPPHLALNFCMALTGIFPSRE
jgi:microcystin-dependent protein